MKSKEDFEIHRPAFRFIAAAQRRDLPAVKLQIEAQGCGPDLVLLHGWGMNARVWGAMADELARTFRVHAVNLPGYGGSGACQPYTLDALTDTLADALPRHIDVCGWSLGGQLALNWALRHPRQIKQLALIATTPRFISAADWDCGIGHDLFHAFRRDVIGDSVGAVLRFIVLQAHGDAQTREVQSQLRDSAGSVPDAAVLEGGLRILEETDLRQQLSAVRQPVFIIHGEHDAVVPLTAAREMQRMLPDAELESCADAGHVPFIASAQRCARSIGEFCRGR